MTATSFAGPGCHTERSGRLREQLEGPAPEQQASIVAYLLLQHPVNLPHCHGQVHRIESPEDSVPFGEVSELIRRTVMTRLENVETVFSTLQYRATTINEVIKITGLGKKVVQRAMVALEKDGRIFRTSPKAANQSHRFRVVVDNEKVTGA